MADSIDPKIDDESTEPKKRFGTGRSFEEVLNEVHRHTSCLVRDWERIQTYLAGCGKRGSAIEQTLVHLRGQEVCNAWTP